MVCLLRTCFCLNPPIDPGQVLFKRKPLQYVATPKLHDDQEVSRGACVTNSPDLSAAQVWVIEETDEVFTSYESYLQR